MNNETAIIVFSKNRALQLDLCLNSFYDRCADQAYLDIKVIYIHDKLHQESYDILQKEHNRVEFIKENNFKQDLLNCLNDYKYVLFCVDDTVFTHDFVLKSEVIYSLNNLPSALGFSLRLGTNTHYCFPLDKEQNIPQSFKINKSEILFYDWNPPGAMLDFAYPLELSSSVYRIQDLYPLLAGMDYNNPNKLEACLDAGKILFSLSKPHLLYYHQSVAFSVPANKVQTVAPLNRVGGNNLYDSDNLLKMYLEGLRIDPGEFYGYISKGCHELVNLFDKGENVNA